MIEKSAKKQKKSYISEEDSSTLLQRYSATTVLTLLKEVSQSPGVNFDWNALVKNTSTGISNAREYQMLWRHLAYRADLLENLEDEAQPMDDDSDLESEVQPCPSVSNETSAEAAACVKVLMGSGLSNESVVDAPLTINIPNVRSSRSSENLESTCSMSGTNIVIPVYVQKKGLSAVPSAKTLEGNVPSAANLPSRKKKKLWSEAEDLELLAAVQKCGVGNWANISRGDFMGDRTASQLSQRWSVIKKRFGNIIVEGNSSQLTEAQLATRSALSLALDMPNKNLTAACTNNPGLKATSGSAPPTANGVTTVRAQSQFQQGPLASVKVQNQSQQGPITTEPGLKDTLSSAPPTANGETAARAQSQFQQGSLASVKAQIQSQQAPITSVSNRPRDSTVTSISSQNPVQQGPVASVQVSNQSQQGPMPTKTSPKGSSGSTLKPRVTLKKAPAKPFSTTGSILEATAVAAGGRIASPKAAASLMKAAQSKNAIHITTSGGSSVKPPIPSGTTSQYVSTGLTSEPLSSLVTSTVNPGSVKPATQRVEHTSAASSLSLNAPIRHCNAVTSGPTVEGLPKEEREIKGSGSDSLPKEQVRENGACDSKNEPGEGVKEHKATVSNPESELKNLEVVAVHPNEKLMAEGDRIDVKVSVVKESENANDKKTDCSLVKKSVTLPTAEESCRNQSMIETPAKASL